MFELNSNGTKAIIPSNDMANICGYFQDTEHVNNGYGCNHPECGDKQNGIGCCLPCNCPLGWEADEEDCEENGLVTTTDGKELFKMSHLRKIEETKKAIYITTENNTYHFAVA